MKLVYNGVDLVSLASHVRILEHSTVREPAEAPQRERVSLRVRLDFFEQSYADNFSLIQQVRAALKTQQAVLLWQDVPSGAPPDGGPSYLERTVTAGEDTSPEDANARGGTYWQALVIHFWYYNHDVRTNCLNAAVNALDMGAVERWEERLNVQRYDELRDVRRLVSVSVSASGRWQADTTQALEARRSALIAQKERLKAELLKGATVALAYGDFRQTVRVVDFKVDVDQPNNFIAWSLSVVYTCYPNEQDYTLCDFKVTLRENKAEGIIHLNLAGRIGAPTESAARAKLARLKGSLVPAAYASLSDETESRQVESLSSGAGDGAAFIELSFNLEYRDASTITTTFQADGAGTKALDLGTVDRFADRYATTLFDELRNQRKRTAGMVTISGKWYAPESLSDDQKRAFLTDKKAQLDAALGQGVVGTLAYGSVFNKVVRVLDFTAELNRLRNCVEWNLSAGFTWFPNESDYALCEFRLVMHENKIEGTVTLSLTGKIGAPTPEAARDKLARLRVQVIPKAGYVRTTENTEENRVDVESDRNSKTGDTGDGPTFIELTFNEDYQKTAGDVLTWTLRVSDEEDAKTAMIRSMYAGSVQATAATITDAFNTAAAKAAELGDGKYPFKVRSVVMENERLFQTSGGQVFVTVEFSYEYQRKREMIFIEVTSELAEDTFGQRLETVSGYIAAATLDAALAAYNTDVRNTDAYKDALILNERKPTLARQRLSDANDSEVATLDDRFTFSFQVLRPKTATSMAYTIEPDSNLQTLELTTVVRGTIRAASQDVASAFLDAFLKGLGDLGKKIKSTRPVEYQRGPTVAARPGQDTAEVFVALHFTETFVALLTGPNGILECEVTEQVQYSGDRLVERAIPDGVSIIQRCGTVAGRRTVQARAVATTETSARAWVKNMRALLLTGNGVPGSAQYEAPPQMGTVFRFLPQTEGVPRGNGANVRLFECSGAFSEILPDYAFS